MKTLRHLSAVACVFSLAGCAGPLSPPLGLGPGLDEILEIVIFAILAALLYLPLRNHFVSRSRMHHTLSPREIAKDRYARGEITEDEFQRMLRQLSESQGDSA